MFSLNGFTGGPFKCTNVRKKGWMRRQCTPLLRQSDWTSNKASPGAMLSRVINGAEAEPGLRLPSCHQQVAQMQPLSVWNHNAKFTGHSVLCPASSLQINVHLCLLLFLVLVQAQWRHFGWEAWFVSSFSQVYTSSWEDFLKPFYVTIDVQKQIKHCLRFTAPPPKRQKGILAQQRIVLDVENRCHIMAPSC